jgi:hypothetical protein
MRAQQRDIRDVGRVNVQRQLERTVAVERQRGKLPETRARRSP